jgi:hypothetical protein
VRPVSGHGTGLLLLLFEIIETKESPVCHVKCDVTKINKSKFVKYEYKLNSCGK